MCQSACAVTVTVRVDRTWPRALDLAVIDEYWLLLYLTNHQPLKM